MPEPNGPNGRHEASAPPQMLKPPARGSRRTSSRATSKSICCALAAATAVLLGTAETDAEDVAVDALLVAAGDEDEGIGLDVLAVPASGGAGGGRGGGVPAAAAAVAASRPPTGAVLARRARCSHSGKRVRYVRATHASAFLSWSMPLMPLRGTRTGATFRCSEHMHNRLVQRYSPIHHSFCILFFVHYTLITEYESKALVRTGCRAREDAMDPGEPQDL